MLEEIQRLREGHSRWTYLWSPYWGQRILLPRFVFLASAKYLHFSMWPFILINVASQISMEIFIEAIGVQYTVGYASAVTSICVMGDRV